MMSWDETSPFELEENENDFKEICAALKKHPFPSPWMIFFKSTEEDEFNTEVSEFFIDDVIQKNLNVPAETLKDVPNDATDHTSKDIPLNEKKVNQLKESLLSAKDSSTLDHIRDVDIFFSVSSVQIPIIFKMLDVSVLSEVAITLLLNAFLHFEDKISVATATALVFYIIFPIVFEIKKSNSRSLLSTILKFSEAYPKAVVDEMMIPYLKQKTSDDLPSDILLQISKTNLPNEYVAYCIKSILENAPPSENSFTILQSLIERKVHHERSLNDLLLKKLFSWTSDYNRNVKFTKLLTSILSVSGSEFTDQQIVLCDEIIKSNKTIIKKAAENLLKKLKQGSS